MTAEGYPPTTIKPMTRTTKQITFPTELWDQIRTAAQQTDRTAAGVVIRAARHGLPHYLADEGITTEDES